MLIDNELVLSSDQAVTATARSTNVFDAGSTGAAPGNSTRLKVHVTEAFNNLTSIDFTFESDDNAAFSSAQVHQKVNVLLAALTLGKVIDLGEVPDGAEQYWSVKYTVNGTAPTTGKVTTVILPNGGDQTIPNQA